MESDTKVILAKRRWNQLYRRTAAGVSITRVLTGNSWCNPSVRFLFDQVTRKSSRQAWFMFGRETLVYFMEAQREAKIANMNLWVDIGRLFLAEPRSILRGTA